MCELLAIRRYETTAKKAYAIARNGTTGQLRFSLGVDSDHFDANYYGFAVPYAFIFSMSIWDRSQPVHAAVFALDRLRRQSRWSSAQQASRLIADSLRISPDNQANDVGCDFTTEIIIGTLDPLAGEKQARLLELWNDATWSPELTRKREEAFAANQKAHNPSLMQTILSDFQKATFEQVIARKADEFYVYSTETLANDAYDYRGGTKGVFRIVSRENAGHKLLHQITLRNSFYQDPGKEEVARWFQGYAKRQMGKLPKAKRVSASHMAEWNRSSWSGLTGMTESGHAIEALVGEGNENPMLKVVFGTETQTGLSVPTFEVEYTRITEVKAHNARVSIRFNKDGNVDPDAWLLEFECRDMTVARHLVALIANKSLTRLARSVRVKTISAYRGNPPLNAIHSGFGNEDRQRLHDEFATRAGRKDVLSDTSARIIRIHVASS